MIQPVTLLGAGICFVVLYLRYRSQPKDHPRRTPQQKIKTAKLLVGALLAWMILSFTLQHMINKLDNAPDREPSLVERVVFFLGK